MLSSFRAKLAVDYHFLVIYNTSTRGLSKPREIGRPSLSNQRRNPPMNRHISHQFGLFLILLISSSTTSAAETNRWEFTTPKAVAPPTVTRPDWVRNDIDAFILARLEEARLEPAKEAGRQTLIRRLYFDLIGLPPTPEEVIAFVGDADPAAYEKVVDRLLKDSRYGERWARLWLDLARYADTAGYEGDPDLPHAWRYRDYVIDAFNNDKPYDEFIKDQIAGDEYKEIMGAAGLPSPKPEHVVALTFLRLAPFTEPRGDETRHEMLSEITSTVGSVFLGLTVGCAKCHDHKYDQIPTKDFYRLKAFFNTVAIPPPEQGDIFQIGGALPAEFYRDNEQQWAEEKRKAFQEEGEAAKTELAEFAKKVEESDRAGLDKHIKNRELFTDDERQRYEYLTSREGFISQHLKRLQPVAMSVRHSFGPPYEPSVPVSRVMIRGEYDNPGEAVEAGFLSCITGHQRPAAVRLDPFKRWPTRSRRMALAQWITQMDNPLTGRVMMNRLWYWHFGRGIVATPSDFGQLSGGPSHPKLLDWLAVRFVEENWSLKAMHRLMVTSNTYRQSSNIADCNFWLTEAPSSDDPNPEIPSPQLVDPDNKLVWRFSRRRLEAEAIRDAVLTVSGRLNPEQFGLPIFPPLPGDIGERVKYSRSKWDTQYGPESRKRSVYIYQQRTLTMPFMQVLDSLVCDESRPRRRSSVTPLQALAMYNGDLVNEESRYLADRIRNEVGDDVEAQVKRGFLLALSRPPTADESRQLQQLVADSESANADPANSEPGDNEPGDSEPGDSKPGQRGLIALCRILYNANEFVYVD